MNNLDRDTLVERYVSGRMSPSEEEQFLRLAGDDPELRHLVKAERIIRGAALRSREAITRPVGNPSGRLMARLAATAPAAPAASIATASEEKRRSPSPFSGRAARMIAAAIGIAGLALGTFVVAPRIAPEKKDYPLPSVMTAPPAPGAARSVVPQATDAAPEAARTTGTPSSDPGTATAATPAARNGRTPISSPDVPRPATSLHDTAATRSGALTRPASGTTEELPVIERDSLQLKVKIEEN